MPENVEPNAELAEKEQEILRLRKLLIAKDAEMAEVKGRLNELELYGQRLLVLRARIVAKVPFAWGLARAIYRLIPRRLRGA